MEGEYLDDGAPEVGCHQLVALPLSSVFSTLIFFRNQLPPSNEDVRKRKNKNASWREIYRQLVTIKSGSATIAAVASPPSEECEEVRREAGLGED